MHRLPQESPENPEASEATPLLRDEDFVIDDDLYAIGGAVGGAETIDDAAVFYSASSKRDVYGYVDEAIYEIQANIDNIVGVLFSAWLRFPARRPDHPQFEDSEILGPRALRAIARAWRRVQSEADVLPEPEVIIQGLAESMVDYMYPQNLINPGRRDVLKAAFTAHVSETVAEGWQKILDGVEDEGVQESSRKRRERRRFLKRVRRRHEIIRMLMFYDQVSRKDGAGGDSKPEIGGSPGCAEEAVQVDIDGIVETLFSAWQQTLLTRSDELSSEHEDCEILGRKSLDAISTAWRQIKAEKEVLPESVAIVNGLVESMVNYMYPLKLMLPKREEEDITVEAFTRHVTEIVTRGWRQIEKEHAKERARKERKKRRRHRQKERKRQEIEEALSFYESFARIDLTRPFDCRVLCMFFCDVCTIFSFQVAIHTLLLGWPISIGVMGGLYMKQCPMSHLMPYVMMALGAVGTIALLIRLSFAIYEKVTRFEMGIKWPWKVLKFIEFTFLDFLMVQFFYFFSETPSFDPGSPKYCDETFYNFVYWINYVSIALVSMWFIVYLIQGYIWWKNRKYVLTHT